MFVNRRTEPRGDFHVGTDLLPAVPVAVATDTATAAAAAAAARDDRRRRRRFHVLRRFPLVLLVLVPLARRPDRRLVGVELHAHLLGRWPIVERRTVVVPIVFHHLFPVRDGRHPGFLGALVAAAAAAAALDVRRPLIVERLRFDVVQLLVEPVIVMDHLAVIIFLSTVHPMRRRLAPGLSRPLGQTLSVPRGGRRRGRVAAAGRFDGRRGRSRFLGG